MTTRTLVAAALPFEADVARYLADCAAHPYIDRRYHPTPEGALKVIYHRTPKEADQIRATFRALLEAAR